MTFRLNNQPSSEEEFGIEPTSVEDIEALYAFWDRQGYTENIQAAAGKPSPEGQNIIDDAQYLLSLRRHQTRVEQHLRAALADIAKLIIFKGELSK